MSKACVIVTIRIAWWVRPYLCALNFFGQLMGLAPDAEKATATITRYGMTVSTSPMMLTED